MLLWYRLYHIRYGLDSQKPAAFSGTERRAPLESSPDFVGSWVCATGRCGWKGPQSHPLVTAQLIRAALRHSPLTPLKGAHTHFASYFRLWGYRKGKLRFLEKLWWRKPPGMSSTKSNVQPLGTSHQNCSARCTGHSKGTETTTSQPKNPSH